MSGVIRPSGMFSLPKVFACKDVSERVNRATIRSRKRLVTLIKPTARVQSTADRLKKTNNISYQISTDHMMPFQVCKSIGGHTCDTWAYLGGGQFYWFSPTMCMPYC